MEPTREETKHEAPTLTPAPATPLHTTPATAALLKKPYLIPVTIGLAVVILLILGLYTKGYLVAATVDGSPISRLAVIQELERQGGEQALKALIDKKLIEKGFSEKGIVISEAAIDEKIVEIEAQISTQGGTLADALVSQGMNVAELRTQIRTQLGLEALLAESAVVTPEEVDAYITDNNIQLPDGLPLEDIKAQLSEQMKQQKFSAAADAWIAEITGNSEIKYYVQY